MFFHNEPVKPSSLLLRLWPSFHSLGVWNYMSWYFWHKQSRLLPPLSTFLSLKGMYLPRCRLMSSMEGSFWKPNWLSVFNYYRIMQCRSFTPLLLCIGVMEIFIMTRSKTMTHHIGHLMICLCFPLAQHILTLSFGCTTCAIIPFSERVQRWSNCP